VADVEGWEARMAARARERRPVAPQRAAHPELFRPDPPDDGTCRACHEWRIENASIGRYAWWMTCPHLPGGDGQPCSCCHCDEAVLIG
jgi:hypothetical protein